MKELMIFGKNCRIVEQKANRDSVRFKNNKILINSYEKQASSLLKEFLADLLYSHLCKIYEQIRRDGKVEVFGGLDFEIVENIDGKKERIAKQKGNKILVKLNAIALPKSALKYIIAHELAHTSTKRHTKKFWKIVEAIHPNYNMGEKLLVKYGKFLCDGWKW